jgi:hypothetical protein
LCIDGAGTKGNKHDGNCKTNFHAHQFDLGEEVLSSTHL